MRLQEEAFINSVNLHAEMAFPYLVLNVVDEHSSPRNPGFQVMHWHEDLQFIYVRRGAIEVETLDDAVRLREGEGVFLNKNVVHRVRRCGSCHYNSFIFPESFLTFYLGCPAERIVSRIAGNRHLPLYAFCAQTAWHAKVLSDLQALSVLEQNKTELYLYEVLVRLVSLWLELQRNITLPKQKRESTVNERMRVFLQYIQKHYFETVTLETLARSANVSKSECLRCFRLSLRTTPCKYLTEFRLTKAAQLLQETNETIGSIATSVGMPQTSYFGKCFKEKTGCSPRAYRSKRIEERDSARDSVMEDTLP